MRRLQDEVIGVGGGSEQKLALMVREVLAKDYDLVGFFDVSRV